MATPAGPEPHSTPAPRRLSPRRRVRLARSIFAATVLVCAVAALGYAVSRGSGADGDRARASVVVTTPSSGSTPAATPEPSVTSAPAATPTATTSTPATSSKEFAPVVTDRIPAPTTSIALKDAVPGTTNMQPSAASAWTRAVAAAKADKVALGLKVGWRSAAWQQVLRDKAVTKYGSQAEAAKWVLLPEESGHVKGYAVDVTARPGAAWLEREGSAYGFCRTYENEWWHFEYLATSACPAVKPNAAG